MLQIKPNHGKVHLENSLKNATIEGSRGMNLKTSRMAFRSTPPFINSSLDLPASTLRSVVLALASLAQIIQGTSLSFGSFRNFA